MAAATRATSLALSEKLTGLWRWEELALGDRGCVALAAAAAAATTALVGEYLPLPPPMEAELLTGLLMVAAAKLALRGRLAAKLRARWAGLE